MCDVDYGDRADLWRESTPRARKRYTCSECELPILPGTVHLSITLMDEGHFLTFRQHKECNALLRYLAFDVCHQHTYFVGTEPLRERAREHMHEAPEVLRRWRDILRQRRAEGTWPVPRV